MKKESHHNTVLRLLFDHLSSSYRIDVYFSGTYVIDIWELDPLN